MEINKVLARRGIAPRKIARHWAVSRKKGRSGIWTVGIDEASWRWVDGAGKEQGALE